MSGLGDGRRTLRLPRPGFLIIQEDGGGSWYLTTQVRLAFLRRPGGGAGVPGLGERDEVADVQGAGRGELDVVVWRAPGAAGQPAACVLLARGDRFLQEDLVLVR
ncbi:UNVERIFIED_CONTAM: hypothetical protein RKD50_009291 [Streptomyces canus]